MHVAYDAILGTAAYLRQVRSSQYTGQPEIRVGRYSGGVDPQHMSLAHNENQKIELRTGDLSGLLTLASVTAGLHISSDSIVIPYSKGANGGTFASGLSHFTLSMTDGLIIPKQFTANQQQQDGAEATVEVIPYAADGSTNPVTVNINQALAAQAFSALHLLGPAVVNGVTLSEVVGVTVDTGIETRVKRYGGLPLVQSVRIVQRNPFIEIEFENADALNSFGSLFAALSSAAVYFMAAADGGTIAADDSGTHLSFSFADGIIGTESFGADDNNEGTAKLKLYGEVLVASNTANLP